MAVGAIEPQFYAQLLAGLGLAADASVAAQWERERWPEQSALLAARFLTRARDAWCAVFDGTDACVAPVLDLTEAPRDPHLVARGVFTATAGTAEPAAAPRFTSSHPAMRALSTAALAAIALAATAACNRTNKPPLGTTDSAGARSDTFAPAAMQPIPKNGADTIAVPPAAVDTVNNRRPGQASGTAPAGAATGVDTPITQRMGSPAPRKP